MIMDTQNSTDNPPSEPREHTEVILEPITSALQNTPGLDPMLAPNWLPWRVGHKVGRTIYAQLGQDSFRATYR